MQLKAHLQSVKQQIGRTKLQSTKYSTSETLALGYMHVKH